MQYTPFLERKRRASVGSAPHALPGTATHCQTLAFHGGRGPSLTSQHSASRAGDLCAPEARLVYSQGYTQKLSREKTKQNNKQSPEAS